jgi:hypothetical protein
MARFVWEAMTNRRGTIATVMLPTTLPDDTRRRFVTALARVLARQAVADWSLETATTVENQHQATY